MRKLLILLFYLNVALADQSFVYSQEQAGIAKKLAQQQVEAAKKLMGKITIESLNADSLKAQNDVAQLSIKQAKDKMQPINIEYESGEKYYIFSDKMKNDAINLSKQYQNQPPVDFNQMLKYYNDMNKNSKNMIGDNHLLIFISYSIPKEQLISLIKQAQSINAVFVLRGMIDGSMKKTQKEFFELKKNYQIGAMINPKLFSAFNVTQVPTFVIYKSGGTDILKAACNVAPTYTKIIGSVSIRYALEQLERSNEDGLGKLASYYLDMMDSSGFYGKK
ncbi:MAG: type-F conjugative transfer system pilin assembly protein TrbC [Burkholderiales bacterium]|nr:type-F conjugative transfer system pilin assembly protein TrbC [Burkholderiales bacterium]